MPLKIFFLSPKLLFLSLESLSHPLYPSHCHRVPPPPTTFHYHNHCISTTHHHHYQTHTHSVQIIHPKKAQNLSILRNL
ncbi:hypothetical protein Hanom_Chr16g01424691 [Helianthus anomalus]